MHRVIIVTELVAYPTGFLKRDPDIKIAPVLSEDINCLRRTSHLFLCQIVSRRCTLLPSHLTMEAFPTSCRLISALPSRLCSRRPLPSQLRAARISTPQWRFTKQIRPISAVADRPPVIDRSKSKLFDSADEAVADILPGSTILSAGFGLCGVAETLIQAMQKRGPQNLHSLTAVSNNAGIEDVGGLAILTKSGQVNKLIISFLGNNKALEKQYLSGGIEIELCPQGTLAERIRAAGAGIPAFYTPTAVNTLLQDGKIPAKFDKDGQAVGYGTKREVREFNGKKFLMETALPGDVAIVRAHKADEAGNCVFR
jgi:3-oxoacid CoA-transferase